MELTYISNLINLLSLENIQFSIKNVETAYIDLTSRELIIPDYVFNTKDIVLTERLICHEIAHALFTPVTLFDDHKEYSNQLINYVEDIRIENLFKEKYKGVGKTFTQGFLKFVDIYKEHMKDDLLAEENNILFIDRVNTHFKSNYYIHFNFFNTESKLVEDLKSFVEYSELKVFMDRIIALNEEKENKNESSGENDQKLPDNNNNKDDSEEEERTFNLDQKENTVYDTSTEKGSDLFNDSVYKKQQEYIDNNIVNSKEKNNYLLLEKQTASNIVPYDVLWKDLEKDLQYFKSDRSIDKDYEDIITHSKTISLEFNRKKNARNYKNNTRVKTGVLNLDKLSQHKTSENIFQEIKKFQKQKNHELVLLLDWSTSIREMQYKLMVQCSSIVLFCKMNNIKCKVFAFTSNKQALEKYFTHIKLYENTDTFKTEKHLLLELLNTEGDTSTKIKKFLALKGCYLNYMELNSTPLNIALLNLTTVLKKMYAPDKQVSLIILTDGISDHLAPENINIYTNFDYVMDMDSNYIYKDICFVDLTKIYDFLLLRLKRIIPHLNVLTIFLTPNKKIKANLFNEGMLYLKNQQRKENIITMYNKKNYVLINYKYFSCIFYFQNTYHSDEKKDMLLNDMKINTNEKNSLKVTSNILRTLNNSISTLAIKKIAECIA